MANQWDKKFKQEFPFMALGSLLKAYAEINQGKGKDVKEFKKEAEDLFELASSLVIKAGENAIEDEVKTETPQFEINED